MKRLLIAPLFIIVGCANVTQPTPISIPLASSPRKVIVDTDVSVDDILALPYLTSRPDVATFGVMDSSVPTTQEMNPVIENETGCPIHDAQGNRVRVVTHVDAPRFEAIFLQTLNGQFK